MSKYIKVTKVNKNGNVTGYVTENPLSSLFADFEDGIDAFDSGEVIIITVVDMLKKDFDVLEEFNGW